MIRYFNKYGQYIRNPIAYSKTGAPMFGSNSIYYKKNLNTPYYIYMLTLENGKFYVGKTINIKRRIKQHYSGSGSMVTKKYKPVDYEILGTCYGVLSDVIEHDHVKRLVRRYGYINVRGGKWVNSKTF